MTLFESAKELALRGFHVFPLLPNSKLPAIKNFPKCATRDPDTLKTWWSNNPSYNIGISTTKYSDGLALIAIDVDNKGEKKGDDEILQLELEGKEFPETLEQRTPTGGKHFIYRVEKPLRQGTRVFGTRAIDTRSRGGYVVGAGSILDGKRYEGNGKEVAEAPLWIVEVCGKAKEKGLASKEIEGIDPIRAEKRAREYLRSEAELAVEGESGDQTTYQVACRVKDMGVSEEAAFRLLDEEWNPRCTPPWELSDLQTKVQNAYSYGSEPVGASAPEVQFPPLSDPVDSVHPFEKFNQEYAYIGGSKGHVIHETKDAEGRFKLDHIDVTTFHQNLAPQVMMFNNKMVQISKEWLRDPRRRSYQDFCFMPGKEAPDSFYNLWRGFSVEPIKAIEEASQASSDALAAWKEHALLNVCANDEALFNWLIGYFAHLVQRPWEKPLVALVFRGGKGVGKNALVERVGHLLGDHFSVVSNRRYLTGNFNSVLEDKLFLVLDEAFWSGDKAAEGVLKDLITGRRHLIERKGQEPYTVDNCLRLAIIGNEEWLVPASEDERRYAVFNVGDGRKQDLSFFKSMRFGMEQGGYALLLRYLLDFDLSQADVDRAPDTEGLLEQKIQTLDAMGQWWRECLIEGRILGSDFGEGWSREITKRGLREAYQRYVTERRMDRWASSIVSDAHFSRRIKAFTPSMRFGKKREDEARIPTYQFSAFAVVAAEWEQMTGEKILTDEDGEDILS